MRLIIFLAFLIPAGLFIGGCGTPVTTRSYDVYVTNKLSEPITVFITKDGPPDENGWLSPEELAVGPISGDPINSGRVVGPGFVAGATKLVGKFEPESNAILRVYHQTGRLENFVAISQGDPRRVDVLLRPGVNAFEVRMGAPDITVTPVAPPAATSK